LFLMVGGQPTVIQGWNSIDACSAAKTGVGKVLKEKHGGSSYIA
jgi:hypothetical protein